MSCLISQFLMNELAAADDLLPRLLFANGLWSVLPLREDLIRYAIIFCSLCVMVQLYVMWGTKWGDRNLFVKSFVLSLFLHLCLAMNWYSFSQVGKAAAPTADERATEEPLEEPKTELMAIQVQVEPVNDERDVADQTVRLGAKRPVSQLEVTRRQGDTSALRDEPEMPTVIRNDEPRALAIPEIPMMNSELDETVRAELQSVAPPQMPNATDRALPQVTDDSPQEEEVNRPPSAPANRRKLQRSSPGADSANQTAVPNRVRQPVARQPNSRLVDDGAFVKDIGKSEAGKPQEIVENEIPLLKTPPPLEEIRKQPAKSTFVASGVVTNAMTGKPIAGVIIRVDQISSPSLKTRTESDGSYRITLSDLPDNFAITASVDEFIPVAKNLSRGERNGTTPRMDFQLLPTAPTVVVVEENPGVHHVGDDRFEGRVNSQFQRRSEGESVTLRFRMTQNEQQLQQVRGVVRFLAKGIQCAPEIRINRVVLTDTRKLSAEDGSFGPFEYSFDSNLLRRGNNSIEIRSTQCAADLDDFEFVNVQVRLEARE